MAGGGFAFNFLPPEDTGSNDRDSGVDGTNLTTQRRGNDEGRRDVVVTGTEVPSGAVVERKEDDGNHDVGRRRPFHWIEDLPSLLADRSKEEIVYDDLSTTAATDNGTVSSSSDDTTGRFVNAIRRVDCAISSFTTSRHDCDVDVDIEGIRGGGGHERGDEGEDETAWTRTDLQPGVYEGGMKVWESSMDLACYIAEEYRSLREEHGQRALIDATREGDGDNEGGRRRRGREWHALELGCGHGLPGCCLLRSYLTERRTQLEAIREDPHLTTTSQGGEELVLRVVFTDYNDYVVRDATLSNIILNTSGLIRPSDVSNHVAIGAGDWMLFSEYLSRRDGVASSGSDSDSEWRSPEERRPIPEGGRFDLILAAETVYTETAAEETAAFLSRHLQPESGSAFVAAKRYYFGVGGGADCFRRAAADLEPPLHVETVRVYDNGAGNIREILRVRAVSSH